MTTVRCRNSVFLHIPKTAGSATFRLLLNRGLVKYQYRDFHAGLDCIREEDKFVPQWAIVRHPAAWIESYFYYKQSINWSIGKAQKYPLYTWLDQHRQSSIDSYVDNIYKEKQNIIESVFKLHINDNTVIGVQEDLLYSIQRILTVFENDTPNIIPMHNRTRNKGRLSNELEAMIWEYEGDYFSKWFNPDRSVIAEFRSNLKRQLASFEI